MVNLDRSTQIFKDPKAAISPILSEEDSDASKTDDERTDEERYHKRKLKAI